MVLQFITFTLENIKDMKIKDLAKRTILPAVLILSLSSCRKEVMSLNQDNNINSSNSIKLNEDELLHKVTFNVPAQNVKTAVNGNVLTMVYTEDISVLLEPKGFDLSYSIRLNESFANSALAGFSYTLPAPNGSYTSDWAGNDLKVLNEVTKSNVKVDGRDMVSLHLVRYFTFTKSYNSAQEAVSQQTALLNTKTDVVKFNSFVVFGKEYPPATISSGLIYSK